MQNYIKQIKQASKERIREIKTKAKNDIKAEKQHTLEVLASKDLAYKQKLELQKQREEEARIPKRYSIGEEIFNSVTHGIGAGLALAAVVLLVTKAAISAPQGEKGFYITGVAIFGGCMFVLYLMSTLYHALTPYHVKKVFAIFDHSSIYLLIAGTYTPLCLGALRHENGWWLFGIIWVLAICGITFYSIFGSKMRALSAITYVLMGWLIVFAWKPLVRALPPNACVFLIAGGITYTIGCIFYALKKVKWTHFIWHLFVLGGSILHFFAVWFSIHA